MFPLALRAAASHAHTAGPDLAAVSTVGYTGFLLGPPAIGLVAEQTSLRVALLLICSACVVAATLASQIATVSTSEPVRAED